MILRLGTSISSHSVLLFREVGPLVLLESQGIANKQERYLGHFPQGTSDSRALRHTTVDSVVERSAEVATRALAVEYDIPNLR